MAARDDHLSRPLEPALRMTHVGRMFSPGACVAWWGEDLLWGKRAARGHRGGELQVPLHPLAPSIYHS